MECSVCYEAERSGYICCTECGYQACRLCVETYLITMTTKDPHCMKCRAPWDILFMKKNMDASFLTGPWKERTMEMMWRRRRSTTLPQGSVLRPCPLCAHGNIMKETLRCNICWVKTCGDCASIMPNNGEHQCEQQDVESLHAVERTTRRCPSCHVPIERRSGCSQMFCTHCATAFDWDRNTILPHHVHNPHYFEHYCSSEHKSLSDCPTSGPLGIRRLYMELFILVQDIGRQLQLCTLQRAPLCDQGFPSKEDLYQWDQEQQKRQCQLSIWARSYKEGHALLRQVLTSPETCPVEKIREFRRSLKETLIECNEYVAPCMQLRGHRLFVCGTPPTL